MPPAWLTALAWASLAAAVASAGLIAADIALRGHRQRMTVMNLVWPITGLYLGLDAVDGTEGSDEVPEDTPDTADFGGEALGDSIKFGSDLLDR